MRRYFFLFITLGLLPMSVFAADSANRIDMGVSPIKYELTAPAGKPTTKTITFYNNSNAPYEIYLTAEDCVADSQVGTPECRPVTATGSDPESLASWISFGGSSRFVVPAKSEKKIDFTITPPLGAYPGGHYGAVFLNNLDKGTDGGNAVKMIRRAGVLLLINIPGKLIYDTKIGEVDVDVPLFSAPSDPKRVGLPKWKQWRDTVLAELDPRFETPMIFDTGDFVVKFTLPIANSGNTHILPVGRVEIFDEKGSLLEKIGKESIRTAEGVFIGEKIVDYLPINDEGGNVLPNSNRVFSVVWRGFAYETVEGGKSVIKFLSPQSYYSQLETKNAGVLMPWEKYRIKTVSRTLKAKIYLEYKGENGQLVPYDKEQDLKIEYLAIKKDWNYGAILIVIVVLFLIWFISYLRKGARRIDHLEEEVEYLESEVDELEKGRLLAQKALEKKGEKSHSKSEPKKSPAKKPVAKGAPKKEVAPSSKTKTPARKKKESE